MVTVKKKYANLYGNRIEELQAAAWKCGVMLDSADDGMLADDLRDQAEEINAELLKVLVSANDWLLETVGKIEV